MGTKQTPRMSWVYPTADTDPWFDTFVSMLLGIDADGFAAREDRNLILISEATFSWTGGTLTWDDDIVFMHPHTGKLGVLAAGSASLPTAGQMLVVELSRASTVNYTLTASVLSRLDNTADELVLCVRYGDVLYWRNGSVFDDGFSGPIGGSGGTSLPSNVVDALLNTPSYPDALNPYATITDLGSIGSGLLRETLTPQITGANTTYNTSVPYQPGSLRVYRNGVHQQQSGDGKFVETNFALGIFDTIPIYLITEEIYVEFTP
jgi:hypothetical protein